jgi:uncharacterized protein
MSTLRHRSLGPKLLCSTAVLAVLTLFTADALRPPQTQLSARAFSFSVDLYHRYLHPITSHYIRCRYRPTCSAFAVQAVRRYGIAKGGWLSLRRIASCRPSVPMGTSDPVP